MKNFARAMPMFARKAAMIALVPPDALMARVYDDGVCGSRGHDAPRQRS